MAESGRGEEPSLLLLISSSPSQVTIHNINESKFLGNPQQVPISNHVEITRIPAIGKPPTNCDKLAVGSERRNLQTESNLSNGCE